MPVRAAVSRQSGHVAMLLVDLERCARSPLWSEASLSGFASLVTHEIRNPLSTIKMSLQIFEHGAALDERERRRLSIASREVRTIERVLNALSELSRNPEPHLVRGDVATVVGEALEACEQELEDREVILRIAVDRGLPPVAIEADRIRLALSHLLVNAAHAMRGGGEVSLSAQRIKAGVCLRVRDRSSTGAEKSVGAGLSLAMVEKIVRAHGGSFSVKASAEGTECRMVLRVAGRQRA